MSISSFSAGGSPFPATPVRVHPHRWRIDEQHGVLPRGRCDRGAGRDFENAWSEDSQGAGWMSRRKPR